MVCNIDDANAFAYIMLLDCMYYAMEVQMMLLLLCLVSANHVYVCVQYQFLLFAALVCGCCCFLGCEIFFEYLELEIHLCSPPIDEEPSTEEEVLLLSVCPVLSC